MHKMTINRLHRTTRASITLLLTVLTTTAAEPPRIPLTNQIARYEREQPVFQSKEISRERGDALLALLDGGRATERWMKNGLPPGFVCVLPIPAHLWMTVTLTNARRIAWDCHITVRFFICQKGFARLAGQIPCRLPS